MLSAAPAIILLAQAKLPVRPESQVGYCCGMVGKIACEAPALKRADVGIAVQVHFTTFKVCPTSIGYFFHLFLPQGSTDAARAAADVVLTDEGLG